MLQQEVSYLGIGHTKPGTLVNKRTVSTYQTSFILERITVNPEIRFGKPVIKGTRITVQDVRELLNAGLTFDEIIRDYYPDLTREDIEACRQYPFPLLVVS